MGTDAGWGPIVLTEPARRVPAAGPVDVRWFAALSSLAGVACLLMFGPLLSSSRQSRNAPVSGAGLHAAANAIVGIRSDRLGVGPAPLGSPDLIERRLAHLRLSSPNLRSYTYVLAKLAFVRPDTSVGSPESAGPAAERATGFTGLRQVRAIGVPLNVTDVGRTLVEPARREVVVFQKGNTPAAVLAAFGMEASEAASAGALLEGEAAAQGRSFAAGDLVELSGLDPERGAAKPSRITFTRAGTTMGAVALSDSGRYATPAAAEDSPLGGPSPSEGPSDFSASAGIAVSLRQGLLALVGKGGLAQPLVDDLVRICAREIDLGAPAQPRDTVSLLFSPESSEGRPEPELAYVSLVAAGREHRFYRFARDDGVPADYFDDAGRSGQELLLRKPVALGRLGDGFGWRIHPVLGDRRFHEGVDYAAPFGEAIVAAGAGTVEKIDVQWGYGKYIRIRHDEGYETTYAHVSGYPAEMRVGARVRQGQTIAYIGSTGLSTGPHLYYEVRINGRDVDPLRVKLASGPVLRDEALQAFAVRRDRVDLLVKEARAGAGSNVVAVSR